MQQVFKGTLDVRSRNRSDAKGTRGWCILTVPAAALEACGFGSAWLRARPEGEDRVRFSPGITRGFQPEPADGGSSSRSTLRRPRSAAASGLRWRSPSPPSPESCRLSFRSRRGSRHVPSGRARAGSRNGLHIAMRPQDCTGPPRRSLSTLSTRAPGHAHPRRRREPAARSLRKRLASDRAALAAAVPDRRQVGDAGGLGRSGAPDRRRRRADRGGCVT